MTTISIVLLCIGCYILGSFGQRAFCFEEDEPDRRVRWWLFSLVIGPFALLLNFFELINKMFKDHW